MKLEPGLAERPLAAELIGRLYRAARFVPELRRYLSTARDYRSSADPSRGFELSWRDISPKLHDATADTGFDRHYVFHTAWAARALRTLSPAVHHDIGSSLYFSAIVSAFVPVRFFDYRPAELALSDFRQARADLLGLPFLDGSLETLSCMHVVEHVGLGRYGEPVDAEADLKAIEELKRVVAPGGSLLFVVPVAAEAHLVFNAHRVYSIPMVLNAFTDRFALRELALIPDDPADGDLVTSPPEELVRRQRYGCGCFWFERQPDAARAEANRPE
jgi:SAM-dependent methyltransferase